MIDNGKEKAKEELRALLKALVEEIARDTNTDPKVVAQALLNAVKEGEEEK